MPAFVDDSFSCMVVITLIEESLTIGYAACCIGRVGCVISARPIVHECHVCSGQARGST